jgi:hypothetical protein
MGEMRNACNILEKYEGKRSLGRLYIDEIILEWFLKK